MNDVLPFSAVAPQDKIRSAVTLPRLGFLGLGRIGRLRFEALALSGVAELFAVADPVYETLSAAREIAPRAIAANNLDELLDLDLDGIVIATPSALHAEQTIAALKRGCAVFCQKPLARTAAETCEVVNKAREVDRLLGISAQ